jgi:Fur family ferric uptake transcriptional regulator
MHRVSKRRRTQQRAAIEAALSACDDALSAQELYSRLSGDVGLATVYRNLQRLADEGRVDALRRPSGEVAFRACGRGHHHHLTCRMCGRVDEVRDCGLERWAAEVAREHGFSGVEHHAELTGLCSECRKRSRLSHREEAHARTPKLKLSPG